MGWVSLPTVGLGMYPKHVRGEFLKGPESPYVCLSICIDVHAYVDIYIYVLAIFIYIYIYMFIYIHTMIWHLDTLCKYIHV